MSFPNSLKVALENTKSAALAAQNISNVKGIKLGLIDDPAVSKTGDRTDIKTTYRTDKASNHEKLEILSRIETLHKALEEVMAELAVCLPHQDIHYEFQPLKNKHLLNINGRDVLFSAISTWKQQFPLICRVFHDDAPKKLWLIDTNFHPEKSIYATPDVTPAPSLSLAYLRSELASAPLKERHPKTFRLNKMYVAAELIPANTVKPQAQQDVDKTSIQAAWNELQENIKGMTTHIACFLEISTKVTLDKAPSRDVKVHIHPLMDVEEQAKCYRVAEAITKQIDRFVQTVSVAAPQATYTVGINTFAGRVGPANLRIGQSNEVDAGIVADKISAAQNSGLGSSELYVIQKNQVNYLVRARSVDEAIANSPIRDFGSQANYSEEAYIARPLSSAEIEEAMDEAHKEWEKRQKP